ncbi:GNAT family N-acetyltransferase [Marinoscillum sp. 108]|jgi:GNAT superfamily N-acetyltransferase|uniref:GNAT family N-acetyltransferase n=1 Tax=Marinoscillum sp. 108 TaxID=2653151 RepID=UPI0012F14DA1|nr:GNAT family N-acetyltransferase [Marinoscillum sp. 108]VXD10697.1 GNAT family N-acetyltransferase [Marinoscillum sp. 108]
MNALSNTVSVQLLEFQEQYASDFARLNYEWLETYFTVEPHDREMLDAPNEYIIQSGGRIFFAKVEDEIVGTVALIVETPDTFELAKMGVTPKYKGLKIGKMLMQHAISEARKAGMERLVLESNTKLTAALNLYINSGFKVAPLNECSPYARCNIRMELTL